MLWQGQVAEGQGNCFKARLFPPGWYQGSLNLHAIGGNELHDRVPDCRPTDWATVEWMPVIFPIYLPDFNINGIMGLDPVTRVHEVVARSHLRSMYGLANGDIVNVEVNSDYLISTDSIHASNGDV